MHATAGPTRTLVRESARQRRLDIIEAALRVMRRDGLRAITHRAVAIEAAVPLAATTYYFRDLSDLMTEAFLHWSAAQEQVVEAFHEQALALIAQADADGRAPADTSEQLADAAADYVAAQVGKHRDDRVLEFAFLHEALRVPRLRAVLVRQQRAYARFLTEFHRRVGSPQPEVDAQITNSLLLGLEKGALLAGSEAIDREGIRSVLLRYLLTVLPRAAAKRPNKRLSPSG